MTGAARSWDTKLRPTPLSLGLVIQTVTSLYLQAMMGAKTLLTKECYRLTSITMWSSTPSNLTIGQIKRVSTWTDFSDFPKPDNIETIKVRAFSLTLTSLFCFNMAKISTRLMFKVVSSLSQKEIEQTLWEAMTLNLMKIKNKGATSSSWDELLRHRTSVRSPTYFIRLIVWWQSALVLPPRIPSVHSSALLISSDKSSPCSRGCRKVLSKWRLPNPSTSNNNP